MGIIENIKDIGNLVQKMGNMDLYRKIIELEGEVVGLTRENLEMEKKIEELNTLLETKKAMTFRPPFYFQEGDSQPFCPKCWEADRKAIHLDGPSDVLAGPRYDCPNCKNHFIYPRRSHIPAPEPRGIW